MGEDLPRNMKNQHRREGSLLGPTEKKSGYFDKIKPATAPNSRAKNYSTN
jgi:hypothetical protein